MTRLRVREMVTMARTRNDVMGVMVAPVSLTTAWRRPVSTLTSSIGGSSRETLKGRKNDASKRNCRRRGGSGNVVLNGQLLIDIKAAPTQLTLGTLSFKATKTKVMMLMALKRVSGEHSFGGGLARYSRVQTGLGMVTKARTRKGVVLMARTRSDVMLMLMALKRVK